MIAELTGAVRQNLTPTSASQVVVGPLSIWTDKIAELTGLDRQADFAEIYSTLMNHLDTHQFKGQLKSDSKLWIGRSSKKTSSVRSPAAAYRKDVYMTSQSASVHSTDTDRMIEEELDQ